MTTDPNIRQLILMVFWPISYFGFPPEEMGIEIPNEEGASAKILEGAMITLVNAIRDDPPRDEVGPGAEFLITYGAEVPHSEVVHWIYFALINSGVWRVRIMRRYVDAWTQEDLLQTLEEELACGKKTAEWMHARVAHLTEFDKLTTGEETHWDCLVVSLP